MDRTAIFVVLFLFKLTDCFNSESFEKNGVEASPFYETIIYSDIANIIKEFENNNLSFEKLANDSDSDEDVEDLLSEYHHYLEKAHKQRVNYMEKSKLKNKVPSIRNEKFSKLKSFGAGQRQDLHNNIYNSEIALPQSMSAYNMFMPYNSNKDFTTNERPSFSEHLAAMKKFKLGNDNGVSSVLNPPKKSSCYCKDGRATCKQCSMSLDHIQQKSYSTNINLPAEDENEYVPSNPINTDLSEDTLNIRVKVEVQVPKAQVHNQLYNNQRENREKTIDNKQFISNDLMSAIKLPSPYFNFPIPMNLFGYKKMIHSKNVDTLSPLHKLTMHKKKKNKPSNGNKKHRKKVITFHNIKIEPQSIQSQFDNFALNLSESLYNQNESNTIIANVTACAETNVSKLNMNASVTPPSINSTTTENQTEENIIFLVNITNNIENGTNEKSKTENSIETEYKNVITNSTAENQLHVISKRDVQTKNKTDTVPKKPVVQINVSPRTKSNAKFNLSAAAKSKKYYSSYKIDRSFPSEVDLLYWPNNTIQKIHAKNITDIILESENKRQKLNMSAETLRRNHTRVLEQAIFGNVEWNDVDSVAPAFISFFGKYINGILTFCSEHICHSMKCNNKNCIHRVCVPKDRFNNKGHCIGSNKTDSVASMESIMDLPSNIAFEIVEILKDRMLGKLYGKITLCINPKCITFAAYKKTFIKYKCTEKELSPKGHCVKSKDAKVI